MTGVVIVDDQALVREGIGGLLKVAGIEVVGQAGDGQEALAVIQRTEPDVVLLDLQMPKFDGIWTLEKLRDENIDIPVLVLTTFDDDGLVLNAVRAGARGYLLKDVTLDQLRDAVQTLADGGSLISPSVTDRLLRAVRDGSTATDLVRAPDLTERELEIVRLMAAGYSNRQIATALFLAEGTVKNHISTILTKLGARDRTNAVLRALRDGILT